MKLPITVIVAAKNEEANIGRCIGALQPAHSIYVVDSGSTDRTAELAQGHGAEVVQFVYRGGYPRKRQWAIDSLPITTQWVLLIDADELVSPELWTEISVALRSTSNQAYSVLKQFHFMGKRLRFGGFSHSAVILFRKGKARFEMLVGDVSDQLDMEVHERLLIDGAVGRLAAPLIHDDFKTLSSYIDRHNKYSTWEAAVRCRAAQASADVVQPRLLGNVQERRRLLKRWVMRMPFESALWFAYHYVFRLGILEGRRGLIASQIRCSYIQQVRAKMFESRIGRLPQGKV